MLVVKEKYFQIGLNQKPLTSGVKVIGKDQPFFHFFFFQLKKKTTK